MRLIKARVQKYRSVMDSGWFDVEESKTILVGANEAGKTAILQALQQINAPQGTKTFDPLRDYPRSEFNNITTGTVKPEDVTIVEAHFALEAGDIAQLPLEFHHCVYVRGKKLDNNAWHRLDGGESIPTFEAIKKDLIRLSAHADKKSALAEEGNVKRFLAGEELSSLTNGWSDKVAISAQRAKTLKAWLQQVLPLIDETNKTEEVRYDTILHLVGIAERRDAALRTLDERTPVIVLFSNYFRVRPLIHLDHLAYRLENDVLEDDSYDYGNKCLLQLLGFSARELSNLGKAVDPEAGNLIALKTYQDQLDKRSYQLNAASVRLSNEIRAVWNPNRKRSEAERLRVVADAQYLKVVVEDDLGVEIELNQRSEGFQWLVSFFIVFFAEAAAKHENAILLLDEPGLSLHGLKQREFRETISRLSLTNQTIYTTHSPFLVGPDELALVRVVEMIDRKIGTKVHTNVSAQDPASLLPLQEALGYDLAQSLFGQTRNLVLEGLTDYWYVDAVAHLLRDAGGADLDERIALVPAGSAGKVVYYATLLFSQRLKVVALLDSDAAGEQAAKQEVLVHTLGNKGILRTKDVYNGPVGKPEIEDLLRSTLLTVAKSELGWDVTAIADVQTTRPVIDIFESEATEFSKYRLAKAFLRWTRNHKASDLKDGEQKQWTKLINKINGAFQ